MINLFDDDPISKFASYASGNPRAAEQYALDNHNEVLERFSRP